ncbi:MAG: hypothetical protein OHK0053_37170 [Microscillaceae bacterium]
MKKDGDNFEKKALSQKYFVGKGGKTVIFNLIEFIYNFSYIMNTQTKSKKIGRMAGNHALPGSNRWFYVGLMLLLSLIPLTARSQTFGTNIVSENALTGNPASEWELPSPTAGDLSIQGFATDISYNRGETAAFKIKTDASAYQIKIYRLGYYQGNGARFIADATVTASLPQSQPACITETSSAIKLVDCGNWAVSATWTIPTNAISGIYIAKLVRTDNGGASHIAFIVCDDASTSDLLFQTSDATWQAYNGYDEGSNNTSLYTGPTSLPGGHSAKVSYNRPFVTRSGGAGGGAQEDWLFNSEYPMLRWLERNGYDVSYTTNVDTDRRGNLIANHKVFLSVGHDEYWSKAMRDNVTAARNASFGRCHRRMFGKRNRSDHDRQLCRRNYRNHRFTLDLHGARYLSNHLDL